MRKTEPIYLGDEIETKKTFKPFLKDETKFDPEGVTYKGVVVGKRGKFLLVNFNEELPFTHHLGNILDKATGCGVDFKDLVVTETFKTEDKKEQAFVGLMKELRFGELDRIPREIRSVEDSISNDAGSIKSLLRDVAARERTIEGKEFDLKDLKKRRAVATVDTGLLSKQYKKLMSSPFVKGLEVIGEGADTNVLVTTENLRYHREDSPMYDFDLGAYKILIPTNPQRQIQAANYKKHVQKFEYHHPCIAGFKICMGSAVWREIQKLRDSGGLINLVHVLINFLQEPDYNDPYLVDKLFSCAQDVTIRPRDPMKWFSEDYWRSNEKWDSSAYIDAERKVIDIIDRDHCSGCGSLEEANSDGDCPECGFSR